MSNLWKKLSYTGAKETSGINTRNIVLTNQIAIVVFLLSIVTAIVLKIFLETNVSSIISLSIGISLVPVWILNYFNKTTTSRFFISFFLPTSIVVATVYTKLTISNFTDEFEYYDSRLLLLATSTLPFIFFEIKENHKLIIASSIGFLFILFYDPIHNLFNVGYYQVGHESVYYQMITHVMIISYFIIVFGILFLKSTIHKSEQRNNELIQNLKNSQHQLELNNENLLKLNNEISESHKAIEKQAEELKASQEQIFNSSQIIASQRAELETKNQMLELKLRSQDKSLLEINTELVKRNNELRQFGYTVSHNLRGPIASLLGLANLFNINKADESNKEIINHIYDVSKNLDTIIKDLNYIVEIRKDAQIITEPIDLDKEINVVLSSIRENITATGAKINLDLEEKTIDGIKAYIHSIFHNLIENSLKFRSEDRPLEVSIRSYSSDNSVFVTVEDNGIGFDVTQHHEDIFHLYKRLHEKAPGRGLGLYLTKLQVESLNGEIMVNSVKNQGTSFTINFPAVPNV